MYTRTPGGRSPKGSVQVITSNERLQLRFRQAGKRYYLSIGFPDTPANRKLAEMKAREIELDILSGHFDQTLAKYKPESVLSVSSPDIEPEPLPKLSALWERYVQARQKGKSPSTIRMYGWVANHIDRCPHKTPAEAQAVFDWFNNNVPDDSSKRVMMHLSACCKWAQKSGLLEMANPFEGMQAEIKPKKTGTEEEEIFPFTKAERDRIIETFGANRYYKCYAALMKFLFFTGCRPSEAIALCWKHIGSSTITFNQAVVYSGHGRVLKEGLKTQKARKFPINSQLRKLLADIKPDELDPEALIFPSPRRKFINWGNFTNRAWQTIMASLPDIEYRNPYQTRHTFCSLCREAGISSIQIAKWVGNSPQIIDRVYAKPTDHVQVPEL